MILIFFSYMLGQKMNTKISTVYFTIDNQHTSENLYIRLSTASSQLKFYFCCDSAKKMRENVTDGELGDKMLLGASSVVVWLL